MATMSQFRGRFATGQSLEGGDFTTIGVNLGVNYRQFKDKFVFAPNEMQQVAFEGAKQNECLEDGAERLWAMGDGRWARGKGREGGKYAAGRTR